MHRAQLYLVKKVFATTTSLTAHSLTDAQTGQLITCLNEDALSYVYSASVTIGDALGAISRKLLTWSTIKLYYSTFYTFRSLLALDGIAIFYFDKKPFSIVAKPGSVPHKKKGQTHKIVLNEFKLQNTVPFLLSQEIDFKDPLRWLIEKREAANYKVAKFVEPEIPKHFEKILAHGLRKAVREYLLDRSNLFLFDADHAILAYPLRALQEAYEKIRSIGNLKHSEKDTKYLNKLFKDKKGPIPEIYNMINK